MSGFNLTEAQKKQITDLLAQMTVEEKEWAKKQVADYHKYYDLTHYGDLYRLTDPAADPFFCDWEMVSRDKGEVLFTRVVMRKPENYYQMRRLKGLDPQLTYQVNGGTSYPGDVLMNAGYPLPVFHGDYSLLNLGMSLGYQIVSGFQIYPCQPGWFEGQESWFQFKLGLL